MSEKVLEIIKDKNIVIPLYIYKMRKQLELNLEEFLFLIYLYNFGNKILFDINLFSEELDLSLMEIMELVDKLSIKRFLELETIKNEKGIIEEYINLDLFYEKINHTIIQDTKNVEDSKDVFQNIEKEFGRTLSPIEIEIIRAWLEAKISEEMINLALREASFNGVNNLKYIDRILFEWEKLNLRTKEAIENHLSKRNRKREESSSAKEVFDYDWLNSDE